MAAIAAQKDGQESANLPRVQREPGKKPDCLADRVQSKAAVGAGRGDAHRASEGVSAALCSGETPKRDPRRVTPGRRQEKGLDDATTWLGPSIQVARVERSMRQRVGKLGEAPRVIKR